MEEQFIEAVSKAIGQLVLDFQRKPTRYWSERDIHWCLFHHLKEQDIFQRTYKTELIRAEFPTCRTYKEGDVRSARGHYDLVVLEPKSFTSFTTKALQEMELRYTWGKYLELVKVLGAVEVKMWWSRRSDFQRRVEWDIEKLTDSENAVKYPYFLNFVQLDFSRPQMKDCYHKLRKHLIEQAKCRPKLKILCVPSDVEIQPPSDNWISVPK